MVFDTDELENIKFCLMQEIKNANPSDGAYKYYLEGIIDKIDTMLLVFSQTEEF